MNGCYSNTLALMSFLRNNLSESEFNLSFWRNPVVESRDSILQLDSGFRRNDTPPQLFQMILIVLVALISTAPLLAQPKESGLDDYFYAQKLYDEKYYDLAADQLERILRDYPQMSEAEEALYLLAESYFLLERYNQARASYLKVAIMFSESSHAPESLFKVAICLEKLNRQPEAAEAYQRILGFYPNEPQALEGLIISSTIYNSLGDTVRADVIGDLLIDKYPDSQASDMARLAKAYRLIEHGDNITAKLYLSRIAERFSRPELASAALYELGKLLRHDWELDEAEHVLQSAVDNYPETEGGVNARLELADLLTYRGFCDRSIVLLSPLLKSSVDTVRTWGAVRTGDAYYRIADYERALKHYNQERMPQSELKIAWTLEILGRSDEALEQYFRNVSDATNQGQQAYLRSAILASHLGQNERSIELWKGVTAYSKSDRIFYELCKAYAASNTINVTSAVDSLLSLFPDSPFADEALYMSAIASENVEKYPEAVRRWNQLIASYPASVLADSALMSVRFTQRYHIKADKLVESMAELSSNPTMDAVDKAIAWGDFYLNQFSDPVKAIDQFEWILNSIVPQSEGYVKALHSSGIAYLLLYEAAVRENDPFSMSMYRDSTLSRLARLSSLSKYSDEVESLASEFVRVELGYFGEDSVMTASGLKVCELLIKRFNAENVAPDVMALYLDTKLSQTVLDEIEAQDIVDTIQKVIHQQIGEEPIDNQTEAKLKRLEVIALNDGGWYVSAIDSAMQLWMELPHTIAGASIGQWLLEQDSVGFQVKLDLLEQYEGRYSYLLDVERHARMKSQLLDSLNRPMEALEAYHTAELSANWGRPDLDILSIPDEPTRYRQANAFFHVEMYERAYEEYRVLLNLNPNSKFAPQSMWKLAQIHDHEGQTELAIAYIDTLKSQFPESVAHREAIHLRPELFVRLGDYRQAKGAITELLANTENPDSLFHYRTQEMVCLYRTDQLQDDRKQTKAFFNEFKEREDLDQVKSLFTLEMGKLLDRAGLHEKAREEYQTILKKYLFTQWADDAAYAEALSFISEEKFAEGIVGLTQFVENYPESELIPNVRLSLGLVLYQNEQFPDAVSNLRKVWENEQFPQYWLQSFEALLEVYRGMRFYDAAIRLVRDYIDRFPNAPDVLDRKMDIGQYYLQLGQWDETVRYYRPLIALADAEREAEMQFYIGEAFFYKKDYRTAILEYLKVKILGRKTKLDWAVTSLYQIGLCYEALEEYEGAARMYRQIIKERGEASNYGRTARKRLDELPQE